MFRRRSRPAAGKDDGASTTLFTQQHSDISSIDGLSSIRRADGELVKTISMRGYMSKIFNAVVQLQPKTSSHVQRNLEGELQSTLVVIISQTTVDVWGVVGLPV